MTYAAELDDRRQEVRRGHGAAFVVLWPKVLGQGNVLAGTDPAPLYSLLSPAGEVLATGLSPSVDSVGGVTRFRLPVNATALDLGEGYAAVLAWNEDDGGPEHITTIRFDVVLEPYDGSDVSLNDLVDEVADIREMLLGQVDAQADERTVEEQASLLASKATEDVKRWIRAQLEAKGRIYPRLILDREGLRAVVVAQAVARAYRAQGGGAESAARTLYEDWTKEAQDRLRSLGELDYDETEDRVADRVLGGFNVVTVGRSWL